MVVQNEVYLLFLGEALKLSITVKNRKPIVSICCTKKKGMGFLSLSYFTLVILKILKFQIIIHHGFLDSIYRDL